jgi:hypothetical protein
MTSHVISKRLFASLAVWAAIAGIGGVRPAFAQNAASRQAAEAPPIVEWVYQVKWGYFDDFYAIFKKYQIAILDEEKKEGLVTKTRRRGLKGAVLNRSCSPTRRNSARRSRNAGGSRWCTGIVPLRNWTRTALARVGNNPTQAVD